LGAETFFNLQVENLIFYISLSETGRNTLVDNQ